MSDIFISYSSKDRAQADQLSELLRSAGLSVWIDQEGIEVATSWSREIVQAIDDCKAFVLLLSPASLASHNVMKEVSLASEKRKKILPLDLEPVTLNADFEYALAGLQRSPMSNIDGIIRALGSLGLEATGAPVAPKIVKETDGRKSLMILPFEDLSPTQDNQWFTDGIASELISVLSKLKSLRVIDWNTSKLFRERRMKTIELARDLDARYFIEGQVRKFGDQLKISITLLDIESGDHLWQDTLKGMMEDVFDIQEKMAERVSDGLQLHLAQAEKGKLSARWTQSTEAYELFLRAREYHSKLTFKGLRLALELLTDALRIDQDFAPALYQKALTLTAIFATYDRTPSLIHQAEQAARRAIELDPGEAGLYSALGGTLTLQGKIEEAEAAQIKSIEMSPGDGRAHYNLGIHYTRTEEWDKARSAYLKAIELNPSYVSSYWNLRFVCINTKDHAGEAQCARAAIAPYEKYLRLFPDDTGKRSQYALFLHLTGQTHKAREVLTALIEQPALDGATLYDIACMFTAFGDHDLAIDLLERAIAAGFVGVVIHNDPDLDPLREMPRFKEIVSKLELRS
jgi:adenylate cyclase